MLTPFDPPDLPPSHVPRDNLVDLLADLIESNEVVLLDGDDGIGRTTLLTDFCRRYPHRAVGLFTRAGSPWGRDPRFLLESLARQLLRLTGRVAEMELDEASAREIILESYSRLRHLPVLVVLDGVNELLDQNEHHGQMLVNVLPFGTPKFFKFVISQRANAPISLPAKVRSKSWTLPALSSSESGSILRDAGYGEHDAASVHRICAGVPARIMSFVRLAAAGETPAEVAGAAHKFVPEVFEQEWRRAGPVDAELEVLAIVAAWRFPAPVVTVGRLCGVPADATERLVARCSFLETVDGAVSYVSEVFRRFAETRLSSQRRLARTRIVDELLAHPLTSDAVAVLPDYVAELGRSGEFLDHLSPEFFLTALAQRQSLGPLRATLKQALDIATTSRRNDAVLTMSFRRTALQDAGCSQTRRLEVQTRGALGDFELALSMARAAPLVEERFELLALIARQRRMQHGAKDPMLAMIAAELRSMADVIPEAPFNRRAPRIAEDLLSCAPELAIAVLAAQRQLATKPRLRNDAVLARLSIASAAMEGPDDRGMHTDKLTASISDPTIREVVSAGRGLLRSFGPDELIKATSGTGNVEFRVHIVRDWCQHNRASERLAAVIISTLQMMLREREYVWSARDVAGLLHFLRDIQSDESARQIMDLARMSFGDISRLGPAAMVVRARLAVAARTKRVPDDARWTDDVVDAYFFSVDITDLSTRLECYCVLLAFVATDDAGGFLEHTQGLRTEFENAIRMVAGELASETAEHVAQFRGPIRSIAGTRPDIALGLLDVVNVQSRRDKLLVEAATACVRDIPSADGLDRGMAFRERIRDPEALDQATMAMLDELESADVELAPAYGHVTSSVERIADPQTRCHAACLLYTVIGAAGRSTESGIKIEQLIIQGYEAVGERGRKITTGFRAATVLSDVNRELACKFAELASTEHGNIDAVAHGDMGPAISAVRVAVAAFAGLLPRRVETETDLSDLRDLIAALPNPASQIYAWADVSLRFWIARREADSREIVQREVLPLLTALPISDPITRDDVFFSISPVLHLHSPADFLRELKSHSEPVASAAAVRVVRRLAAKAPLFDPVDTGEHSSGNLDHNTAEQFVALLAVVQADHAFATIVGTLARSCDNLTRLQKENIAGAIKKLQHNALPWKLGIQHEGYVVLVDIWLLRLREEKHVGTWSAIVERIVGISNRADKVHLIAECVLAMPRKLTPLREKCLTQAEVNVSKIHSGVQRAELLKQLAAAFAAAGDVGTSRRLFGDAIVQAGASSENDAATLRREIVEDAHRTNPEWAEKLVKMLDDDPARKIGVEDVRERFTQLQASRTLVGGHAGHESVVEGEIAAAGWAALAALHARRAGSGRSAPFVLAVLAKVSDRPIRENVGVALFALETLALVYSHTDESRGLLRQAFVASVQAAQLAAAVARRQNSLPRTRTASLAGPGDSILIGEGEGADAEGALRRWLRAQNSTRLTIVDPYFTPESLKVIRWVQEENPELRILVLTGIRTQESAGYVRPFVEAYQLEWNRLSSSQPPDTELLFVGTPGDDPAPFHDRWWLTDVGGIRLGTSVDGLGSRLSEVSVMSAAETARCSDKIAQFVDRSARQFRGQKVTYELGSL